MLYLLTFFGAEVRKGDDANGEIKEFKEIVSKLSSFTQNADKALERLLSAEEQWFFGTLLSLFK
jgi:hypothetical protein